MLFHKFVENFLKSRHVQRHLKTFRFFFLNHDKEIKTNHVNLIGNWSIKCIFSIITIRILFYIKHPYISTFLWIKIYMRHFKPFPDQNLWNFLHEKIGTLKSSKNILFEREMYALYEWHIDGYL